MGYNISMVFKYYIFKDWILSPRSIEDSTSLAGRSLAPLYSGDKAIIFDLQYNISTDKRKQQWKFVSYMRPYQ